MFDFSKMDFALSKGDNLKTQVVLCFIVQGKQL